MRWFSLIAALTLTACSSARLVGPAPIPPPVIQEPPVVVVIEPFFENAPLKHETRTETVTTWGGMGTPRETLIVRDVSQKPLFARVQALEVQHRIVIDEVRRLRPEWRVISTGELRHLEGPVRLVRVIVGASEIAGSNRPLKSVATAFGVVIWPLLLVNVTPVHEVQRVHGLLTLYTSDAADLRARLVRYPTQPDFAVDTRGLSAREQPFALDLEYEEGLFAAEERRGPVLLRGFSERLAVAVVAIVEGIQ